MLAALVRVLAAHVERAREGLGVEAAGGVDPLAEAHDLHPAHDVREDPGLLLVGIRDEEADRVGPTVDCCDSHWSRPSSVLTHGLVRHHSGSRSSASSPRGLTPGPAAKECATRT